MVWFPAFLATLVLAVAAVTIASVIGIVGAWAALVLQNANRPRWVKWFTTAMLLAVVTPLILHAAAWEATAGKFGIGMLTQTGTRITSGDAYGFFAGFVATAWLHGLHGGAMVGIAVLFGANRLPRPIIEQASLDAGPWRRFTRVILPMTAPWWTTALMATAGLAITEMTVADLYGYRTVSDEFYRFFAIEPTLASVSITCILPVAIAATVATYTLVSRRRIAFHNMHAVEEHSVVREPIARVTMAIAGTLILAIAALLVVIPAAGLINNIGQVVEVKGDDVRMSWSPGMAVTRLAEAPNVFASEYQWTAIISAVTGIVAIVLAWPIAAWGRRSSRARRVADVVSIALVCLPGPIVGLMVVRTFQLDVPGFRFLYQQTIVPTVIALLFRAGPIAYWIIKSGYAGIETSTLELASTQTSPLGSFWFVERPLVARSLLLAGVAAAVASSGDLPAMLPVVPAGVTTVPIRLFGLLHSGARYQEAALSLWYLLALVAITSFAVRRVK